MKLSLQHRVVRNRTVNPDDPNEADVETVDPVELAQMLGEVAVKTVGGITAVIVAHKIVGTICEIAVITAKAKIK